MNQIETRIFECLFLHDTQMADLEREQTLLRKEFAKGAGEGMDIPFNISTPFCPMSEGVSFSGKLAVGAPCVRSGWIIRPVREAGKGDADSHDTRGSTEEAESLPGYPPLPVGPVFILGYAGNRAQSLLEAVSGQAGCGKAFTVSARYRAKLTLEISREKGCFYGCERTVGPARWEKA